MDTVKFRKKLLMYSIDLECIQNISIKRAINFDPYINFQMF